MKSRLNHIEASDLFDQMPVSTMVATLDRVVLSVNKAFEEEFGYRREDIRGVDTRFLYPDDDAHAQAAVRVKAAMANPSQSFLLSFKRKDGSTFIGECLIVPIQIEGEAQGFFGITRNVSQAVNAQKALIELSEELRASNEDLTYFAHSMAHDLKEPLRKISAFGDMLSERLGPRLDDDDKLMLDYMVDGARRAQTMIDAMFEFAQVGHTRSNNGLLQLESLIEEVCEDLALKLEVSRPVFHCQGLGEIHADRNLMWRVFQNLLSNSLRYRNTAERLIITLTQRSIDDEVEIEWRDNGIGFENELSGIIFEPFRRAHIPSSERPKGTGMGLAIVKRAITHQGGRVWASSEPGKGTTITIRLPVHAPLLERDQAGEPPLDPAFYPSAQAGQ
ncbi:sensor histidine kinase [Woodsholea maritima]|uniref:sensor histidine kinase n=1 Tax=Woodsholea maritima TaxID=240237 RepID=UPI00036DF5A1|nr:PAS domain-containing sensor histidine kinase [Woodsholea maritima]